MGIRSWYGDVINSGFSIASDLGREIVESLSPGVSDSNKEIPELGVLQDTEFYTLLNVENKQYIAALDKHKKLQYAIELNGPTKERVMNSYNMFAERTKSYKKEAIVYRLIRYLILGSLIIIAGGLLYLCAYGGYLK